MKAKGLLGILLIAVMLLCFAPDLNLTAEAAVGEEFTVDGVKYTVLSETDKTVSVTYYDSSALPSELVIPETVTNNSVVYSVTTIRTYAFWGCSNLTSVTIPDSVTTIGNFAFQNCTNITQVTIGDSVTTIGAAAFTRCSNLTQVTIGDSVTTIGDYAFIICSNLTQVTIPDSVTTIGESAFEECTNLTQVKIPDSVTTIGDYAFCDCGLTSVTIPESVLRIGSEAFNTVSLSDVSFKSDELPSLCDNSFKDSAKAITEIDNTKTSDVTVEITGFKNGENIDGKTTWMGELFKPVVKGYTGSDTLYYRFDTDNNTTDGHLTFYTSDTSKQKDGCPLGYFRDEAYAAIRSGVTPGTLSCSVYTMKYENGKTTATKLAETTVTLNYESNADTALEKELTGNVIVMAQGDSTTLQTLLAKAGFTHVTCDVVYISDICTVNYNEQELTVNAISDGDMDTLITASTDKTGLSKLTFKIYTDNCDYHGTAYNYANPYEATVYIYVMAKPEFTATADSITVKDNTASPAASTYQVGLMNKGLTFTGLTADKEYDVQQLLTVQVGTESYTGIYHHYVTPSELPAAKVKDNAQTGDTGLAAIGFCALAFCVSAPILLTKKRRAAK